MIVEDLKALATDIGRLSNLPDNPRKGNVDAVANSLATFGQRKPVIARKVDGVVIAGNHTLQAARQLGWTEIAVVWVEDDEITAKAYALADNRTADLGTYDDQLLADMILAVQQEDEQLLAMSGWDDQAVQDLLYIIETGGQMPNVPGSDDQDGAGHAVDLNEKYEVVVECSSEQEQEALLLRLSSEGLKVRAIIV